MSSNRIIVGLYVALGLCFSAFSTTSVGTESKQTSEISWDVLDSGGGLMCSPSYSIGGSLGQISPGVSVIETRILSAGYWAGIDSLPPCEPTRQFIRGDADGNGGLTIGDGLRCFRCQFVPGWQDSCRCDDAVDANDNGAISIGDCLRILRKQFVPGWQDSIPPPCCTAPVDCGTDPTEDELGCDEHPACGTGKGDIVSEQEATGREHIQRRE